MIAYLQGTVLRKLDKQIVVSTQGVGYLVHVGQDILSTTQESEEVALFIHTRVKEDDLSLYGFRESHELTFFQQLIGVSGIGTKTAMGLLDMPLQLTQQAIQSEDLAYLSKAPGLGKKTAQRLVLELKGKITVDLGETPTNALPKSLQEEAMEALESLGYDKPSIIRFMNTTDKSFETAEEMVRSFLQNA